jgi:hypothetical protein
MPEPREAGSHRLVLDVRLDSVTGIETLPIRRVPENAHPLWECRSLATPRGTNCCIEGGAFGVSYGTNDVSLVIGHREDAGFSLL